MKGSSPFHLYISSKFSYWKLNIRGLKGENPKYGHSVEEEINKRFLAENNFSQLNLKNTFYISHQYPSSITSQIVHGYRFGGNIGKFIPPQTDVTNFSLSYAGAAGAMMMSNTEDITQWVRALLTPDKVLPAKQLAELVTLVSTTTGKPLKTPDEGDPNGFGLGIGLSYAGSDFPGLIFNYEGMTMGYRAQYIYIPNKNLIISFKQTVVLIQIMIISLNSLVIFMIIYSPNIYLP